MGYFKLVNVFLLFSFGYLGEFYKSEPETRGIWESIPVL